MIEAIETSSPKVIGFRLSGKLRDDDFKIFAPAVDAAVAVESKVRLFAQFDDFHGWDMRAAWDDFKVSLTHYSDLDRIAMVGDRWWEKWMTGVYKPTTKAKVKYFDRSEVDAAWKWLEENDQDERAAEEDERVQDALMNAVFVCWRGQ